VDLLQDQLADGQSLLQNDGQLADVPDLELNGITGILGIAFLIPEASRNGRGRDVNPESQTGQAALALHAGGQPRAMR
jgi:hypothetical protein